LSDIRVIEIGTGVAAGWCAKVFGDLGADVVKVEPHHGDPLRGDVGQFAHLNTNKRSVLVAPGASGRPPILGLLNGVDLVVEAEGMGTLADWQITPDDVMASQPTISIVRISGFGATGPYAGYAWSDLTSQAFSGTLLVDRLRGPMRKPMSVQQCAVGHTAAVGALAAVVRARATGVGAFIDCSAVEALAATPTRMSRHLGWEYDGRRTPKAYGTVPESMTLLPIGVFPCADGHVSIVMTPQQAPAMLDALDSDELRTAFGRPDAYIRPDTKEIIDGVLYAWLFERTREEVTEEAQAAGWPVLPVNDPADVLRAAHLHQRGFWVQSMDGDVGPLLLPGSPTRFAEGGFRLRRVAPRLGQLEPPVGSEQPDKHATLHIAANDVACPPLRGVRILDLTTVWSGPLVTMHLADLGAEVIRIENPRVFPPTTKGFSPRPNPRMLLSAPAGGYGQAQQGHPDRPYNRHSMNNSVSRNKLSCTLDLRNPEQRELFRRLVAVSDALVENLKSGTLAYLGIHETELLAINPRLIILRLPAAGLSGDWSGYIGFGGMFDGLVGLSSLCGERDTTLVDTPGTLHMDDVTGPSAAFAALAALHYRASTGRGQVVEFTQCENVVAELGEVFVNLQLGEKPRRYGNRDRTCAPQGLYSCADGGLLALTVTDDGAWRRLTSVIGRADLAGKEQLVDAIGRQRAHDEIDEAIGEWALTIPTYDAFHALQDAGVAAAPVLDEAGFAADPQVLAREWVQPLSSRDVGEFGHLGHAFRGIPMAWDRGSPALGENNVYVYQQVLGLSDAEFQCLVDAGIAVEDYFDKDGRPA
jgi:crotonobetainyl-CoA:carnitine CoA-transferase CaiB-like acyl-CoA transferase